MCYPNSTLVSYTPPTRYCMLMLVILLFIYPFSMHAIFLPYPCDPFYCASCLFYMFISFMILTPSPLFYFQFCFLPFNPYFMLALTVGYIFKRLMPKVFTLLIVSLFIPTDFALSLYCTFSVHFIYIYHFGYTWGLSLPFSVFLCACMCV